MVVAATTAAVHRMRFVQYPSTAAVAVGRRKLGHGTAVHGSATSISRLSAAAAACWYTEEHSCFSSVTRTFNDFYPMLSSISPMDAQLNRGDSICFDFK